MFKLHFQGDFDFDPPENGDQIANFASNGLPLKIIAFLILRNLGLLKFLKNLENCKFFYFGEKWWSKFIWIQFGSVNGLPPPDILIFSSIHSTGHFTIKMAPKTEFFNFFDNFQSIGREYCGFFGKKLKFRQSLLMAENCRSDIKAQFTASHPLDLVFQLYSTLMSVSIINKALKEGFLNNLREFSITKVCILGFRFETKSTMVS